MISHFNFTGSDLSLYFDISSIQPQSGGLQISGTVGDGSAEAWFEANVGERLQVRILPVWNAGSEALCQRYDLDLLEQALAERLEDVSFCSELIYDQTSGCWQQQIKAVSKSFNQTFRPEMRVKWPHLQICEPNATWRQLSVC